MDAVFILKEQMKASHTVKEVNVNKLSDVVSEKPSFFRKAAPWALGFASATGIGMASGAVDADEVIDRIDSIGEIGGTIAPPVSSAGTEALISANDTLRAVGPYVLAGSAAVYGGLLLSSRRNEKLDASFKYLDSGQKRNTAEWLLPAVIIGSVAVASGLGDTAGRGANEPVRVLAEATGAKQEEVLTVTQHDKVIPFNHSNLTQADFAELEVAVDDVGGKAAPYILALGNVFDPDASNNPSSAPIAALPTESIEDMFGVSLASNAGTDCQNMQVVIGEQLGAKRGDTVFVEGRKTEVVGTAEILPGLDRVAVFGSLEQLHECIFENEPFSGAVVIGLEDADQLQQIIDGLGMEYSAQDLDELKALYSDFWDRSVKPVEMQLALLVLGTGAAGVTYIRNTEILKRRKDIAALIAEGVTKEQLQKAERIRSLQNAVKASGIAIVPLVVMTAVTNSSQYGLDQAADLASLGAGATAYIAVSYLSGRGANKIINNMDVSQEMRS